MPNDPEHRPPRTSGTSLHESLRQAAPYLTLGIQLALAVLLFFFLGWWIDDSYATAPWGQLAGVAIGAVGGMIKFIRTVTDPSFNSGPKDDLG